MQSSLNFDYKVASNRSNAAKYAKLNNNYKSISNVLIFLHLMYLGTIHVCCSNLGVFHRLVYISIDFETNGDQPENLTIIEHNINSFISVFYLNTNCIPNCIPKTVIKCMVLNKYLMLAIFNWRTF